MDDDDDDAYGGGHRGGQQKWKWFVRCSREREREYISYYNEMAEFCTEFSFSSPPDIWNSFWREREKKTKQTMMGGYGRCRR